MGPIVYVKESVSAEITERKEVPGHNACKYV